MTFAYSATGDLLAYDDGATSARYIYDAVYRKTREIMNYGPFAKTITYDHDRNGQKSGFTGPDGIHYTYTYDAASRLAAIKAPELGTITYADYKWTRPTRITLPGGTTRTFSYDPLMRIQEITSKGPNGNVILDYRYAYDRMNNITTKQTEHGDYHFGYDSLDQLIEAKNPTLPNEAFTYDPVGNRLTSKGIEGAWSYNANNELEHYDAVSFRYDANGNTVERAAPSGVSRYEYNAEDRMIRVEDDTGSLIATYAYDPFGRRLWKEVAGKRVYFLYSDEGLIGEYDNKGKELRAYGYVPGSTWTTDPVFLIMDGVFYYYQNDHLGVPQILTMENGKKVWSALYDSFGRMYPKIKTIKNMIGFPGHYYDHEMKLNYNWMRNYSPNAGRYLTLDKFEIRNDKSNLYKYSSNNPLLYFDEMGLSVNTCLFICDMIGFCKAVSMGLIHPFKRGACLLKSKGNPWEVAKCMIKSLAGIKDLMSKTKKLVSDHDKCADRCREKRDPCNDLWENVAQDPVGIA